MISIDDERVRFYLKHQKLIEEWARLAEPACSEATKFLESCGEDIQTLCADLGEAVTVHQLLDDPSWPRIFLVRPAWQLTEREPLVGIGLEWNRRNVSFAGRSRVYTGMRVAISAERGRELRDRLKERVGAMRGKHGYTASASWPAWRYVPPPDGEYWDDLTPYRNQLIESVRSAWNLFAPEVDALLGEPS